MINYNPKSWFSIIFKLHKADTFRKLMPTMLSIGFYTFLVEYVIKTYIHTSKFDNLSNLSVIYSVLGFVISLLLVFRTNSAYDRWWEGRKLWGSLVNTSRNLAIKYQTFLPENHQKLNEFRVLISLYSQVLRDHLRGQKNNLEFLRQFLPNIEKINHLPNAVAHVLTSKTNILYANKEIESEQFRFLVQDISVFTDICGACERIKNTPIPYSYSAFLKKFLFFYVMSMPFAYVSTLGFLAIPIVMFIFYIMASIELVGEEIENPFGVDANDLPIDTICKNINKSVDEIMI